MKAYEAIYEYTLLPPLKRYGSNHHENTKKYVYRKKHFECRIVEKRAIILLKTCLDGFIPMP